MINDFAPAIVAILAFMAVAAIVFVLGQILTARARVQQRVGAPTQSGSAARALAKAHLDNLISTFFDEKRFGVEGSARAALRKELVRAGFFGANAINYYVFYRFAVVAVIPTGVYLLIEQFLSDQSWFIKLALVAVAFL